MMPAMPSSPKPPPADVLDEGSGDGALEETSGDDLRDLLGMSVRRAPAALSPGQLIDDAYRIDAELGAGGMGRVYRAHDLRLERDVAIKLHANALAPDDDSLRKEGVALARLTHPNVVHVYEVGTWAGHPWVAMEYVPGGTARSWLAEAPRTPREILALYLAAGRGLAAAHAAGLVHRDFKPDNVLVGTDGRICVADFGLARELGFATTGAGPADQERAPDRASGPITPSRTLTGPVIGTPAYMAPEQRIEGRIDAAADQFAFAVALWEGLEGTRPFTGETDAELAANASASRVTPPTAGRIPRHVEAALRRAMAVAPTERWPSMDALLAELARDPARTRRRFALAAVAAVAAGGLVTFALTRGGEPEPCQGSAEVIASAWGGPGRSAAIAHLASLTSAYARESTPRLTADLDAYASRWAELHRGACQAHQHGEISSQLLDRRAACLAIRKAALATVRELAETSSAAAIPQLVVATSGLPELGTCEDDGALLTPIRPPTVAQVPAVRVIGELIARIDVERDGGRADPARRDADTAVAQARGLGYPPLLARALLSRGRIDLAQWRGDRGAAVFVEATRLALAAGDDAMAVEAYARAAWAISTTDDPAKATDGLDLIEALTVRISERSPFPRALLHNNLGGIALSRGDRSAARAAFERARSEAVGLRGAAALELTVVLLNLLVVVDDPAAQASIGKELVATRTSLLGAHHPSTLTARIAIAELLDDPERMQAELAPVCAQLYRLHLDQRRLISECSHELGWLAMVDGDRATAGAMFSRVLETAGSNEPRAMLAAAYQRLIEHDAPGALAAFTRARSPVSDDAPWWDLVDASDVAIGMALAHEEAGARAAAEQELATAASLLARSASAMPLAALHRRERGIAMLRERNR